MSQNVSDTNNDIYLKITDAIERAKETGVAQGIKVNKAKIVVNKDSSPSAIYLKYCGTDNSKEKK